MRAAIFVDAGYLFAQGSTALAGAKQPRSSLRLNETAAIAELNAVAVAKATSCSLLRIYWYDGVNSYKGPTLEQTALAHLDNVKLRLGFINSLGQQKGVDSLIVTDLIDLARNHAICDAVLLSGDEDVRIGVQIAQNYGVRVHLIGITPSRGSQSKLLLQESDTTTEWDAATVAKFLSITPPMAAAVQPATQPTSAQQGSNAKVTALALTPVGLSPQLESIVDALIVTLDSAALVNLKAHWQNKSDVPPEYDGKLIARCGAALNRALTLTERKLVRKNFRDKTC